MLKIVPGGPIYFSEIKEPSFPMIRENNVVDIDVAVLPKKFNAPPKNRQRIFVVVHYDFNVFMSKMPFEVASASCDYDIFTDRDLHLIELYRLALSVAESLREFIFSQNIPFFQNEEYPIPPPDVLRAKLLPELRKINQSKITFNAELN